MTTTAAINIIHAKSFQKEIEFTKIFIFFFNNAEIFYGKYFYDLHFLVKSFIRVFFDIHFLSTLFESLQKIMESIYKTLMPYS